MKTDAHILIVDDDEDILIAARMLLKRYFTQITCCSMPDSIPSLIAKNEFDAVMLDMNFSPGQSTGEQGLLWLERILALQPDAPVVMITAHAGVNTAVEAMKAGATDFIIKPWQNEKVIATLSSAVALGQSRRATNNLKQTNKALTQASQENEAQRMIGESKAFGDVMSIVDRAAPTDANALILGENGTGKELLAREIHNKSLRAESIFLTVDLGAVSESLFESELFGHKKGAFTGAHQDRIGRIQAADGGTLFLDEVGNLPLHLQAKLLSVLSSREVTPIGGNKAYSFDVRIIAATNLAPEKLRDETIFRQDLLFRLNTVELRLPSLRERSEDIPLLISHYLSTYAHKYDKPELSISDSAMNLLAGYQWPGNIRALRHTIERAVILAQSNRLEGSDFPEIQASPQAPKILHSPPAEESPKTLEAIEKQAIHKVLVKHGYNISHSAKELGLTRAALYRRMEKHGL